MRRHFLTGGRLGCWLLSAGAAPPAAATQKQKATRPSSAARVVVRQADHGPTRRVRGVTPRPKGGELTYQPTGPSGRSASEGKRSFDFGVTTPLLYEASGSRYGQGGGRRRDTVPLVLGGHRAGYNLDIDKQLKFTGEVLADIFRGNIKNWNDPAIASSRTRA